MNRHNEGLNLNHLKAMCQGLCRDQQKTFPWRQSGAAVTGRPRWSGMRLQAPIEGPGAQIPLALREPTSAFYLSESPPGSKKVVFCKSLQVKSLSQAIAAHCVTLSRMGCHWKGGTGLIMWTELLLAPFYGLLPHMRTASLSHCMTWSTNIKKSQVWKHKSKSRGIGSIVSSALASLPAGCDGKWLLLERHIEVLQTGSLLSPARCGE